jgi:hypothetical protein
MMYKRSISNGMMLAASLAFLHPLIANSADSPPNKCHLEGRWVCIGKCAQAGGVSSIREFPDGGLKFINEVGGVSSGLWFDAETVVAVDWEGGLKGDLSDDCRSIVWRNGTSWVRKGKN